jgi:hypothetical protein
MRGPIVSVFSIALLSTSALGGVITVDDSGGADFLDLPPAVAAAQDGDTILVHPGLYSAFALQAKSLTILGLASGQVRVFGLSTVSLVPAGSDVALVDLDVDFLHLLDAPGTIVLDGVRVLGPTLGRLSVDGCADVRAIGLHLDATASHAPFECCGLGGLDVGDKSRCEVVESLLLGRPGKFGWYGETAAAASEGAFLHLAGSSAIGGEGGDESPCGTFCGCPGFQGGVGVRVSGPGSRSRIAGTPADTIDGGATGFPQCSSVPEAPGLGLASGAAAWYSGVTVVGGAYAPSGTTVTTPQPPDPWLGRAAPVAAGGVLVLEVHGRPDDVVTLYLGRSALVQPIPGVDIEQLTSQERAFPLGPVGPSQVKVFSMPLAPNFVQGFGFYAQAKIERGGVELRTNSVPIVVR